MKGLRITKKYCISDNLLKEIVADWLEAEFGVDANPERIVLYPPPACNISATYEYEVTQPDDTK